MYTNGFTEYYRSLWADDVTEAGRIARRYTRKGYRLLIISQKDY